MKKLILSATAVAGFSMAGFAQGGLYFDGSSNSNTSLNATTEGSTFINGVLDTSTDINAELLYSSTATGTFNPIVTLLLSSQNANSSTASTLGQTYTAVGDITEFSALYDPTGTEYVVPGIGAGATIYLEVEGWLGNSSTYAGAVTKGTTAVFTEALVAVPGTSNDIEDMPALNLTAVPEPSTLAMAGVGLASMLIFRRRNK
jgi:hypothetical protein